MTAYFVLMSSFLAKKKKYLMKFDLWV